MSTAEQEWLEALTEWRHVKPVEASAKMVSHTITHEGCIQQVGTPRPGSRRPKRTTKQLRADVLVFVMASPGHGLKAVHVGVGGCVYRVGKALAWLVRRGFVTVVKCGKSRLYHPRGTGLASNC